VAAAIEGDAAKAGAHERKHLVSPHFRIESPAMQEGDRLAGAPGSAEEVGTIAGDDEGRAP
jgi:hypothetical protein